METISSAHLLSAVAAHRTGPEEAEVRCNAEIPCQVDIAVYHDGRRLPEEPAHPHWYEEGQVRLIVDGTHLELGTAKQGYTCLIQTLQAKLKEKYPNIHMPDERIDEVRQHLDLHHSGNTDEDMHPNLQRDWERIIRLLLPSSQMPHAAVQEILNTIRIVCVDMTYIGHGDVLPHGLRHPDRMNMFIARVNEDHFVPLWQTAPSEDVHHHDYAADNPRCQTMLAVPGPDRARAARPNYVCNFSVYNNEEKMEERPAQAHWHR